MRSVPISFVADFRLRRILRLGLFSEFGAVPKSEPALGGPIGEFGAVPELWSRFPLQCNQHRSPAGLLLGGCSFGVVLPWPEAWSYICVGSGDGVSDLGAVRPVFLRSVLSLSLRLSALRLPPSPSQVTSWQIRPLDAD